MNQLESFLGGRWAGLSESWPIEDVVEWQGTGMTMRFLV